MILEYGIDMVYQKGGNKEIYATREASKTKISAALQQKPEISMYNIVKIIDSMEEKHSDMVAEVV
jgi:hypothetical protein